MDEMSRKCHLPSRHAPSTGVQARLDPEQVHVWQPSVVLKESPFL